MHDDPIIEHARQMLAVYRSRYLLILEPGAAMTAQQEPEYIITETLIRQWKGQCMKLSAPHTDGDQCRKCEYRGKGARKNCCDLDDSDFEKMFRSRPHNPSTAVEDITPEGAAIVQNAKREAREEVLNEMRDLVRNAKKYGTIEPEELFHWTGIITMIDSLRGQHECKGEPK